MRQEKKQIIKFCGIGLLSACVLSFPLVAWRMAGRPLFKSSVTMKAPSLQTTSDDRKQGSLARYDQADVEQSHEAIEKNRDPQVILSADSLKVAPVSSAGQSKLYYDQLNAQTKEVFDYIMGNILARTEVIQFKKPVALEQLEKMVYILRWDFPELYYVGTTFSYSSTEEGVVSYTPQYVISEDDYAYMQSQVDGVVERIKEACKGLSRYKTELYVHEYLVKNCTYDKVSKNAANLYGALVEQKAKCDGYSSSMMYILNKCGIKTSQVIGVASDGEKREGHAWNVVELGGQFYYLDATWDDADDSLKEVGVPVWYDYFNFTYDEMLEKRDIRENLKYLGEVPKDNAEEFSYYKREGMYASTAQEARQLLREAFFKAVEGDPAKIVIKCRSKEIYGILSSEYSRILNAVALQSGTTKQLSCRFFGLDGRTTGVFEVYELEGD